MLRSVMANTRVFGTRNPRSSRGGATNTDTAGIKRTCKEIEEIVEKTFNSMSNDTATKE